MHTTCEHVAEFVIVLARNNILVVINGGTTFVRVRCRGFVFERQRAVALFCRKLGIRCTCTLMSELVCIGPTDHGFGL